MVRILVIPDLHVPFEHPQALQHCLNIYKKYKCDTVVCLGDEVDFAGISFHDHNPDMPSPGDELEFAKEQLKPWFKAFPKMRVATSNHTSRPFRKAFKHGIPSAFIKSYREFLDAPKGWIWEDEIIIDEVLYIHGEGAKGGPGGPYNTVSKFRRSVVYGHYHSHGGIQWSATEHDLLFAFNVGCLINPKALAFAYAKTLANRPTLGCGVVLDGKLPIFEPLPLGNKVKLLTKKTKK